jgi:hypothetical protein
MTIGCEAPPVSDKQQGDVFGQLNSIQSCYLQYSMQYNKGTGIARRFGTTP